jgi:hypothetical protein
MTNVVSLEAIQKQKEEEIIPVEQRDQEAITKATKLFSAYDYMNNVKKMREEMRQKSVSVLGDNDLGEKLTQMVAALSPDQIKKLSDSAVLEVYKLEGENEIEVALDFDNKAREIEFKRDFLVYLRESQIANASIDEDLAKLEGEIAADQQELDSLIKDFGDLSTYMRNQLQTQYDAAEGDRKEKLGVVITAYDDSYTLNRVFDHYSKFGTKNTVSDYYTRADSIFTKYVKVIKSLNFRTDLTQFNNLETRLGDDKYGAIPNLFLFSVIKMFAYKKDSVKNEDGVFLSQLAVNLKSLYTDSFADVEKKEAFVTGIKRVLDLFLGE